MRLITILLICLSGPALADFSGRVVGVHDGDTITVLREGKAQKVRLVEIDAPELRQDFGQASKDNLSGLCFGKDAQVKEQSKDKYGRVLGRVTCAGKDANLEQARGGFAWFYTQYGHDEAIRAAEAQARDASLGLWSRADAVPPWEYRHGGAGRNPPRPKAASSGDSASGGECGGKTTCGQMSSCAEARHYLNDCGLSKLDRDRDGIPCESICR